MSPSNNCSDTLMFRFASRVKTSSNQWSCVQKTKSVLLSKRMLSMNGFALPCKSSYIGDTSRLLCECVKEHSKEGSNTATTNTYTKGHPLPNVDQFKVIDQEKSQIACEAKEAIHICKEDPELNKNVGKIHIFIIVSGVWISRYLYKPHAIPFFNCNFTLLLIKE